MSCEAADRIMQSLLVHAPGTTEAMAKLELFNVMDEYLRRTSSWRYETQVTLEEGVLDYAMGLPADSTFVRMLGVSHDGAPVPQVTGSAVQSSVGRLSSDQTFSDGDAMFNPDVIGPPAGSSSFSYAIYRPSYITVTTQPTSDQIEFPMVAVMALSAARSCLESECGDWQVPEWMFDMFFQDWYDGALARLYGMPAKPWSNRDLAIYHGKRFRAGMAQCKQAANRGFVYGVPGWRYPRTGGWV